MYVRERERRMDELQHDYERSRAEIRGEEYADPGSRDYTMARLFSKLFMKEWRYRGRLVYGGAAPRSCARRAFQESPEPWRNNGTTSGRDEVWREHWSLFAARHAR